MQNAKCKMQNSKFSDLIETVAKNPGLSLVAPEEPRKLARGKRSAAPGRIPQTDTRPGGAPEFRRPSRAHRIMGLLTGGRARFRSLATG